MTWTELLEKSDSDTVRQLIDKAHAAKDKGARARVGANELGSERERRDDDNRAARSEENCRDNGGKETIADQIVIPEEHTTCADETRADKIRSLCVLLLLFLISLLFLAVHLDEM